MKNEKLVLSVKEWSKKIRESKANHLCVPINIINKIIDITSYFLAQFVNEYLQTNRPKLA